MNCIQNISDSPELVRIFGEKTMLKPGEIAEVLEDEIAICEVYPQIFQKINKKTTSNTPNGSDKNPRDTDIGKNEKTAEFDAKIFEKMTKSEIADFAQENFGKKISLEKTKAEMIEILKNFDSEK